MNVYNLDWGCPSLVSSYCAASKVPEFTSRGIMTTLVVIKPVVYQVFHMHRSSAKGNILHKCAILSGQPTQKREELQTINCVNKKMLEYRHLKVLYYNV